MRILKKFATSLVLIVFLALVYVNQQSTIIRLSYQIGENNEMIDSLLDQNNHLVYNNYEMKSPQNVELALISKKIRLSVPDKGQIVYLGHDSRTSSGEIRTVRADILSMLGITAEAEAKPLKH
jgi:hypothetical protein